MWRRASDTKRQHLQLFTPKAPRIRHQTTTFVVFYNKGGARQTPNASIALILIKKRHVCTEKLSLTVGFASNACDLAGKSGAKMQFCTTCCRLTSLRRRHSPKIRQMLPRHRHAALPNHKNNPNVAAPQIKFTTITEKQEKT